MKILETVNKIVEVNKEKYGCSERTAREIFGLVVTELRDYHENKFTTKEIIEHYDRFYVCITIMIPKSPRRYRKVGWAYINESKMKTLKNAHLAFEYNDDLELESEIIAKRTNAFYY